MTMIHLRLVGICASVTAFFIGAGICSNVSACSDHDTESSASTNHGDGSGTNTGEVDEHKAPCFADMVLCYGGSHHRKPFLWETSRFADYVTIDYGEGEKWLFDSFLFLEFCNVSRGDGVRWSYMTGYSQGDNRSATKELWTELLDYWFEKGNGFEALDQAVSEAASRLGEPPYKRKVIVSVPDPILHSQYDDESTPTDYWGEIDGKRMDFSKPADRISVSKWFIDEVIRRFRNSCFKQIELDGFYWISEEIPTSTEGWCYELKKSDLFLPSVVAYSHSKGYHYYWIPYRMAAGYRDSAKYGFDYVWMQPNYFWHADKYPFSETMLAIRDAGLGMEIEMDAALLSNNENGFLYKQRFRDYLDNAKRSSLYGKSPFAYYIGGDDFRLLKQSTDEKDRKIFCEFCDFVVNNPFKEKVLCRRKDD